MFPSRSSVRRASLKTSCGNPRCPPTASARVCGEDPLALFLQLTAAQGPPFGAYVDTGDWVLCSASPELFFHLQGSTIESRPMKGTAARGLCFEQDMEYGLGGGIIAESVPRAEWEESRVKARVLTTRRPSFDRRNA